MTQTDPPVTGMPQRPQLPASEELYNTLMAPIEPELTLDQLPLLQEKYKDETPEQTAARSERYTKAYAEYDKQYAVYMTSVHGGISTYRHGLMQGVENEFRQDDEDDMQKIEQTILAA